MSECKRTASTAATAASTSFSTKTQRIPDNYKTFQQLADALQKSGFEACDVVLAIDFTASNKQQGKRTFGGKDLHWIEPVPLPTSVYPPLNPNASASASAPPAYTALTGEPGAPNIEVAGRPTHRPADIMAKYPFLTAMEVALFCTRHYLPNPEYKELQVLRTAHEKVHCLPVGETAKQADAASLRALEDAVLEMELSIALRNQDAKTAAPATATASATASATSSPERKRELNPYEDVLSSMSRAVQTLTASNRIHVVGFGDTETNDAGIFCVAKRARGLLAGSVIQDLARDCTPCVGVEGVLDNYRRAVPHTTKNGPTSFVPLIEAVTKRMDTHGRRYCFVFIIGDGGVSDTVANADAIGRASHYPISISMIGVGDGPWDTMSEFDDKLEHVREFDNFQFVPFHQKMAECGHDPLRFATLSLMEMPDQLRKIKELGLLSSGVTKGTLS